jgi:hypothetical protein
LGGDANRCRYLCEQLSITPDSSLRADDVLGFHPAIKKYRMPPMINAMMIAARMPVEVCSVFNLRPQCGQLVAETETSFPQSGHG